MQRIQLKNLSVVAEMPMGEMRQFEGGGFNPFKKPWRWVKKAAKKTWKALKKPYIGIPVALAVGAGAALGAAFLTTSPAPTSGYPYHPDGLYPK